MARTNLMDVSRQWASRPADERYTSLADLIAALRFRQDMTVEVTRPVAGLVTAPGDDKMVTADQGGRLYVRSTDPSTGKPGGRSQFTHWSFGQLATIASAPAAYLRRLPAPLAALNLNYNLAASGPLAFSESGMTKMLVTDMRALGGDGEDHGSVIRRFVSETYGTIFDLDVALATRDAINDLDKRGMWGIPGTFGGNSGQQYTPYSGSGADTTLYASDHDVFMFLADESRLLEQPGASHYGNGIVPAAGGPNGPRPMSRGFIIANSETGSRSLFVKFFTFDYVCKNRIVWDASILGSLRMRHTSGAPRRFLGEVVPAIRAFVEGSDDPIRARIAAAQSATVGDGKPETLAAWLGAMGITGTVSRAATELAGVEEGRTDTVWAAVQGLTAYARGVEYADDRVELETIAGSLLSDRSLASAQRFERSTRSQRSDTPSGARLAAAS